MAEDGKEYQGKLPAREQAIRKSVRSLISSDLSFSLLNAWISSRHDLFIKYDTDHDNQLSMNDVARAFYEISKKTTSLPAVSTHALRIVFELIHLSL